MKLSSALITIVLFSNINGMQEEKKQLELEEIASVKKKKRFKFLPMNNVRMMVPQLYYGGKPSVKKNTEHEYILGELVDMQEEDPIVHCSFAELAREQRKKGLPYILAVLTVQAMNNKYERRYQDAAELVNWLYNIDNFAYINGRLKYVVNQQHILKPINYFIWYAGEKSFEYLSDDSDLSNVNNQSNKVKYVRALLRSLVDKATVDDLTDLGDLYVNQKKYELAEKYYKKVLAVDKNDVKVLNNLGYLYEAQKKYDLAEKCYKRALTIDKNNVKVLNNLGCLYEAQKKYELAEKYYKRALAIDKNNVKVLNNLGVLYREQKKYELAEEYYKRALAIDKNNVGVLLNIIHLFAIDQASTVTTDQIKDYYQRVQQNSDVIKRYSDGYPNVWKLIQNKMKKILNNSKR